MMRSTVIGAAIAAMAMGSCKKEQQQAPEPQPDQPDKEAIKPVTPAADPAPTPPQTTVWLDPGADAPTPATHAVAIIGPTKGNKVTGTVRFESVGQGLTVKTELMGLPPGKHAYHIHVFGDCTSDDGNSAGTHFHFTGSSMSPPADIDHITGDLGNVEAGKDRKGSAQATIDNATLQGKYSIVGRAVVIHEKPNDPSQPPMGGAGGRLGCGVIGIAEGAP